MKRSRFGSAITCRFELDGRCQSSSKLSGTWRKVHVNAFARAKRFTAWNTFERIRKNRKVWLGSFTFAKESGMNLECDRLPHPHKSGSMQSNWQNSPFRNAKCCHLNMFQGPFSGSTRPVVGSCSSSTHGDLHFVPRRPSLDMETRFSPVGISDRILHDWPGRFLCPFASFVKSSAI